VADRAWRHQHTALFALRFCGYILVNNSTGRRLAANDFTSLLATPSGLPVFQGAAALHRNASPCYIILGRFEPTS
jgi:hypothetical protein